MNRWKFSTIVLLLSTAGMACLWAIAAYRAANAERMNDRYAADSLKALGFIKGHYRKPDIHDTPAGAKPLLTANGTVTYPARPVAVATPAEVILGPGAGPPAAVTGAPIEIPRGTPCSLEDVEVSVHCLTEAMGQPSAPWARITTTGTLKGWGQVRELPPSRASDVYLDVAPAATPPRWGLDFMGGASIGQRPGIEAGLGWKGSGRLGGYALAEYVTAESADLFYNPSTESYQEIGGQPSTWRIHLGVKVRLK